MSPLTYYDIRIYSLQNSHNHLYFKAKVSGKDHQQHLHLEVEFKVQKKKTPAAVAQKVASFVGTTINGDRVCVHDNAAFHQAPQGAVRKDNNPRRVGKHDGA